MSYDRLQCLTSAYLSQGTRTSWNSNLLKWASGFIGGSDHLKKSQGTSAVNSPYFHGRECFPFVLVAFGTASASSFWFGIKLKLQLLRSYLLSFSRSHFYDHMLCQTEAY